MDSEILIEGYFYRPNTVSIYSSPLWVKLLVWNVHEAILKMSFKNLSYEMHTYFQYRFWFYCPKKPLRGYGECPLWAVRVSEICLQSHTFFFKVNIVE